MVDKSILCSKNNFLNSLFFTKAGVLNSYKKLNGSSQVAPKQFSDYTICGGGDYSITLPESITLIGESAFESNTSLLSISGLNVTEITQSAFAGCKALTDFSFPNLRLIGNKAFAFCGGLRKIDLSRIGLQKIDDKAFLASGLEEIFLPKDVELGREVFASCSHLQKVILNDSKTVLAAGQFRDCHMLQEINWDFVKELGGNDVFFKCGFKEVIIPQLLDVREGTFSFNESLQSVVLSDKYDVSIGSHAFYRCSSLHSINLEQVTKIGVSGFAYANLSGALFFPKLEFLAKRAFNANDKLNLVYICCTRKKTFCMEKDVFTNCYSLSEIWINHNGTVDLAQEAFHGTDATVYGLINSPLEKWARQTGLPRFIAVSPEIMDMKKQEIASLAT